MSSVTEYCRMLTPAVCFPGRDVAAVGSDDGPDDDFLLVSKSATVSSTINVYVTLDVIKELRWNGAADEQMVMHVFSSESIESHHSCGSHLRRLRNGWRKMLCISECEDVELAISTRCVFLSVF